MTTVWITGAGGLIGHALAQSAPDPALWRVVPQTRSDLDLLDFARVRERFARESPSCVIHCAAMSRSPECEANPGAARRANIGVTTLLAELAAEARLFFFSTDLVFDGLAGNYDELAATNPRSAYAETKAAAEQVVLGNPGHTVIRTSLNAGVSPTGDRGFDEQLFLAWRRGETTRLFTDEFRSPIAASVTARAVWEMVKQQKTGLYHVAGTERLSRWQIGQSLAARRPELNPRIEPASLKDYSGVPRPPDCSLNCSKVQALLPFKLPGWTDWLEKPL